MKQEERDELIELLRCAADIAVNGDRGAALGSAAFQLDRIIMRFLLPLTGDSHWVSLLRGRGPVRDFEHPTDARRICGAGYEFCLLEAAIRVEQGEWP